MTITEQIAFLAKHPELTDNESVYSVDVASWVRDGVNVMVSEPLDGSECESHRHTGLCHRYYTLTKDGVTIRQAQVRDTAECADLCDRDECAMAATPASPYCAEHSKGVYS